MTHFARCTEKLLTETKDAETGDKITTVQFCVRKAGHEGDHIDRIFPTQTWKPR